jgi:peptidoglycan/LPS O-acetylase OafA/YrhL
MPSKESSAQFHFKELDVMRFIAAIMVVIGHAYLGYVGWFQKPDFLTQPGDIENYNSVGKLANTAVENSAFGVDIFFLISGFLITFILLQEKKQFGKVDFKKFYIRRAFRLWPLYFLLVVIAPLLVFWIDPKTRPDYLSTILFYNNFHAIGTGEWVFPFAHFWSICVEEHFYLVWPFIIAFVPMKRLPQILIAVIFISLAWRTFAFLSDKPYAYIYLHSACRFDALAIGAVGAYFYLRKPIVINVHAFIRILAYVLFIAFFLLDNVYKSDSVIDVSVRRYVYFALVIFWMLNFAFNPKAFFRSSGRGIFHYLGKVSYGIYMYSNILLNILIQKFFIPLEIYNFWFFMAVNICGTILISVISYELFEKRILKLKKRYEVVKTSY